MSAAGDILDQQGQAGALRTDTFEPLTGDEWYGLYTFTFTLEANGFYISRIRASVEGAFGYFVGDGLTPSESTITAPAEFSVSYIPAPSGLALLPATVLVALRRRR